MKKEFTKRWLSTGGSESGISQARLGEKQSEVWQPRFWEHTIEDENDFDRYFDAIHYNPVKHGHVRCPQEWKHSSFHRWVTKGVYPEDWACWNDSTKTLSFDDIAETVGE